MSGTKLDPALAQYAEQLGNELEVSIAGWINGQKGSLSNSCIQCVNLSIEYRMPCLAPVQAFRKAAGQIKDTIIPQIWAWLDTFADQGDEEFTTSFKQVLAQLCTAVDAYASFLSCLSQHILNTALDAQDVPFLVTLENKFRTHVEAAVLLKTPCKLPRTLLGLL